MTIKCISVRQPWAYAIAHFGKDIQNRTWSTRYRGEIFIHAGKAKLSEEDVNRTNAVLKKWGLKSIPPGGLQYGYIIARADLVDCVTKSKSGWFEGPYGFKLKNVEPIEPIPMVGKLGLFNAVLPAKTKIIPL